MMSTDLHDLTLAQLARAIRKDGLSPVTLTEALIARIEALDPILNAFITKTFNLALDAARTAADEIASGKDKGPLHGIPFALKDIYDTAGILTTGHSRTMIDRVPSADATTVRKLNEAGGVLMGKLATHEFAHGGPSFDLPWPPARNPWNIEHFTGGSSSGSGAAIAAGLVPATLGSDTGGSIRGPAGLSGTAGLKPTYGLVSRAGVLPNSYTYDTCGPLARTAEDCALILQAIAGHDPADPASANRPGADFTTDLEKGIKGMRIGIVRHFWETDSKPHPALGPAMDQALKVLEFLGAELETIELRPLQHYSDVKITTAESELFSIHLADFRRRPGDFGQDFRTRALPAALFTAEDYVRASRARRVITDEMRDVYRRFDLLVTANTSAAPRLDTHNSLAFYRSPSLTTPFNCTGQPTLALPCGFTDDGLPLSLQIAGRPFEDATVLRAGYAFECETGYWSARPKLDANTEPVPLDPKPWQPKIADADPAVRARAEAAVGYHGLDLPEPILAELLAAAPDALAMAARLPRDHSGFQEVSSTFSFVAEPEGGSA
jgi:aspartyl-tRNA(Asn)/glutamyl-tRNA(Gln) amidotransferase subunit A